MGLFSIDKNSKIESLKKSIEGEKRKIMAAQSNIAHFKLRKLSKNLIDNEREKIKTIKKRILSLKDDIAKQKAK